MVIVTDGVDNASSSNEAVATRAAQSAGVALYAIGVEAMAVNFSQLRRLSEQTGGRFFELRRGAPMAPIFQRIGQELRSQYVMAFERGRGGRVELSLAQPGLTARVIHLR